MTLKPKRNHRHLSEDVKDAFTGRYTQFTYSTLDKGRVEERIYTVLRPQKVLDESQYESWKNLSSLVQVERLVTFSDGRHSISTISKNSSKFDAVALMQRGAKGLPPNDEGALQS